MDDLPFALWLGMIPTLRVESKGSGEGVPLPVTQLSPLHICSRNSNRKHVTSKFKQKTQVGLALR